MLIFTTIPYGNVPSYKFTINGAHIYCDGKALRTIHGPDANEVTWYDEKHRRVMKALHELEKALVNLREVNPTQSTE